MSIKYGFTGLHDGSDDTKIAAFDVSGVTTATTRTITVPNASGTMAYTESGTFTGTLTGVTGSVTGTFRYTKTGNSVTITSPGALSGTSNSTAKTITGLPATLYPSVTVQFISDVADNGGTNVMAFSSLNTSGVMTIYATAGGGAWTASGTCQVYVMSFSYSI